MNQPATLVELPPLSAERLRGELPIVRQGFDSGLEA